MSLTLHCAVGSPPCNLVLLTAKTLKIDLNLKVIDMLKNEHMSPEYLKLNPQHTVPTLVDGDFVLWESRAISRYLVNKYGAGSKLYPQEPQARALVDQRLDFDIGTLYDRYAEYFFPQFFDKEKQPEEANLKKVQEALGFLNAFLEGNKYVAGSELTIADFSIVASISSMEVAGIDVKGYPNIVRWYEMIKTTVPGYQETVQKNVDASKIMIEEFLNKAT